MTQFRLDKQNAKIGGVCAGLAKYFGLDVTLIRAAFVFALLCLSSGFWLYVILWIIAPSEEILPMD
ncbi:MAG: PspC domain-containing protein [Bacteroidales bacterium]|nr:PspC domain-containing protein [Bacteroidales bacterium]